LDKQKKKRRRRRRRRKLVKVKGTAVLASELAFAFMFALGFALTTRLCGNIRTQALLAHTLTPFDGVLLHRLETRARRGKEQNTRKREIDEYSMQPCWHRRLRQLFLNSRNVRQIRARRKK
jgi:hypothetical protein